MKPIPRYEGLYSITEDGLVFNHVSGERLIGTINNRGRRVILLKGTQHFIHVLVLETYVGSRPPGLKGLHKDDNKLNNHYKNLYWGTHQQNMEDRESNGHTSRGSKHGNTSFTEEDVHAIDFAYDNGESSLSIGRRYGVHHTTILKIIQRKGWQHVERKRPLNMRVGRQK